MSVLTFLCTRVVRSMWRRTVDFATVQAVLATLKISIYITLHYDTGTCSQPAGDVSHKPGGRLPLLSARTALTPATLKRAATNFAAW